jgi:hypothetical protein
LATLRTLGLVAETYSVWPLYAGPAPSESSWHIRRTADGCRLVVVSTARQVIQTAVAGSAAPGRGCVLSFAKELALEDASARVPERTSSPDRTPL